MAALAYRFQFVAALLLLMACFPFLPAFSDETSSGIVTIKSALVTTNALGQNALRINFEYQFDGRSSVHISGLGDVPAKGSFKYLTDADFLIFSDPTTGKVLQNVKLRETVAVAGKSPLNQVPDDKDFDSAGRVFRWTSGQSFLAKADEILGKYLSYQPREAGGITEIATTFAPIAATIGGESVPGRVALLFSFPYEKDATGFAVQIRTLAQEGRPKSDEYRNTGDQAILKSANDYVDKIVGDLGFSK